MVGMPSNAAHFEVDDYGLGAVAQHNAAVRKQESSPRQNDVKGPGIHHGTYLDDDAFLHNPPTPRSTTETEGVRTRSGRSTRRTDSPFSTGNARGSKSPAARSKKEKKSKVLEKAKTPKLTAPLSVLTKDLDAPVKDMDAWVHRSAAVRREEVEKRHGYVTRPMNSFMLYRSAYADRTKQWATQNNHQVVSSVAGESWPMEPEEVRNQFNEWARIERANHAAAHPEYKFSPSKATKKRKSEFSEDEDEASDVDGDPDGEYRAGGRSARQHRQREPAEVFYLNDTVGFSSNPYYAQQGWNMPPQQHLGYGHPGHTLPSNASFDARSMTFDPQIKTFVHTNAHQQYSGYGAYIPQETRIPTPNSQHGAQSLGGYGLPGQMTTNDLFGSSRTGTPAMAQQQQYNPYGQSVYQQQQYLPFQNNGGANPSHQQQQYLYEHQQYLQAASQPQAAIDPGLEGHAQFSASENHFDDAFAGLTSDGTFVNMPEYFPESMSPNQTLAPRWEPSAADLN
ncbi:hypothetical protein BDY17DRAFT_292316 [Neohortaea acidophila]|uniref:HMG box domain-containing protein n=1 Tax=Neohortaea acidophila TaxID=245834 RepID=A0A6A6Q666_9PEZI|nr:uncharacterized protein BDY17DRAFT_292316 [Neohortaea acidophila]KAF2486897.1 hypothetical protein BDY17DRAFT_292316 [Neohortaea acidophila]